MVRIYVSDRGVVGCSNDNTELRIISTAIDVLGLTDFINICKYDKRKDMYVYHNDLVGDVSVKYVVGDIHRALTREICDYIENVEAR